MAEAKRRLAAILSADVAGYSRLMADDEAATVRVLNACRDVFRERVAARDGRVVDTAGDSVLAVFDSVVEAVSCATEIQADLAARNRALPDDRRMDFRIGVNMGDVIEQDDGSIYGDGVNVAARLESLATPGRVAVSDDVYRNVRNKLDLAFEDLGAHAVKNIAEAVQAYQIGPGDAASRKRCLVKTEARGDDSLRPWSEYLRSQVAEDVAGFRPELVLAPSSTATLQSLPPGFDIIAWLSEDPDFAAAWAAYRPDGKADRQ